MNDFFSNGSTYPYDVPAIFRAADLPQYCGNPLIEALPPIYPEVQMRELLKCDHVVDLAKRAKPTHIRAHTGVYAADFFTPLPIHLALYQQLDGIIRSGYLTHNLLVPEYWSGKEQTGQSPRRSVNTKDE